jgi:hypothetical protein
LSTHHIELSADQYLTNDGVFDCDISELNFALQDK